MTQDQGSGRVGGYFAEGRRRISEAFRFAVGAIRGDHGGNTQALAVVAAAALATALGFSHVGVLTAAFWITIGFLLAGVGRSHAGVESLPSRPAAPSPSA